MNKQQAVLMAQHEMLHDITYRQFANLPPLSPVAATAKMRELTDKFMQMDDVQPFGERGNAQNIAEDYVINSNILKGMGGISTAPFKTMCAEDVYNALLNK
jgi:hypothetical protein